MLWLNFNHLASSLIVERVEGTEQNRDIDFYVNIFHANREYGDQRGDMR